MGTLKVQVKGNLTTDLGGYFFSGEMNMTDYDLEDRLLDRKAAAKFLSVSPETLAVWDCTKRYDLKPIRLGSRAVRYRLSTLEKFVEAHMTP